MRLVTILVRSSHLHRTSAQSHSLMFTLVLVALASPHSRTSSFCRCWLFLSAEAPKIQLVTITASLNPVSRSISNHMMSSISQIYLVKPNQSHKENWFIFTEYLDKNDLDSLNKINYINTYFRTLLLNSTHLHCYSYLSVLKLNAGLNCYHRTLNVFSNIECHFVAIISFMFCLLGATVYLRWVNRSPSGKRTGQHLFMQLCLNIFKQHFSSAKCQKTIK